MFISDRILAIGWLGLVAGCGLIDPKFEDYEDVAPGGSDTIVDPTSECGQTAVAAFNSNITPSIDATCATASCHASGAGAAKLRFVGGNAVNNRANLFGFTKFDRGKLNSFFRGGTHPGMDLSDQLTTAKVTAWLDVEQQCTSEQGLSEPQGRETGRPFVYRASATK